VKLEHLQPTGSHKDRGSAVLASALHAAGVRHAVEDSSGNAGASLAAYLARVNIDLQVFVPQSTDAARLRQAAAHGASIDNSARGRAQAGVLAREAASGAAVYASHVYSPYFMAGQMTVAWEIWEGLGFSVPDDIVLPVGHGVLLLGVVRGFQKLKQARLTDRMPRIFGVQARACAPLYEAFRRGRAELPRVASRRTQAVGVRVSDPPRGPEVLAAVSASGGSMLSVSETEIRRGQALMANLGWFIEPTAAVAVAGLVKLDKLIGADETVVVPLTGSGLKS
jgi:threonine synthase